MSIYRIRSWVRPFMVLAPMVLCLVTCKGEDPIDRLFQVTGTITDSLTSTPVESAAVYFDTTYSIYSDSTGAYFIGDFGIPPTLIYCAKPGYVTKSRILDVAPHRYIYDSIDFELAPIVTE